MKLTKFEHACFTLEKDGSTIVVDPGSYSHDFIIPPHTDAIVITHEHPDHLDEARIKEILTVSPKATIIAHESITGRFTEFTTIAAKVGEQYQIGSFSLKFFGGIHAPIAETMPVPANYGVLIDDHFYYPGDSFTIPEGIQVKELALPASAPWMKVSEAMNFLAAIKPTFAFPTHDAILSPEGKELADRLLGTVASGQNTQYKRLDGSSMDLV